MMTITEVGVKLASPHENHQILGYASMVIDASFVIHDMAIVRGNGLVPLVSMPHRKRREPCAQCGRKVEARALYCSHCGCSLSHSPRLDEHGREIVEHYDVCHPINAGCRQLVQSDVLMEYRRMLEGVGTT